MADYFSYLGLRHSKEELIQRFGLELDKLMTLDLNLTGRPSYLYSLERDGSGEASSTAFAQLLLNSLASKDVAILVTGWPVRSSIDVSIGEADGPIGAAAIARALHLTTGAVSLAMAPAPLAAQVAAAFRAAGATIIDFEAFKRLSKGNERLFGVAIVGLDIDCDLSNYFAELLQNIKPKTVIAIEHYGFSAEGKPYHGTGNVVEPGIALTHSLFDQAMAEGLICGSCVDNPNEVGTSRLHDARVKHPPMANDFANLLVGSSANSAAFALCAALAGLSATPTAAFPGSLDEAGITATLAHGAIDPFSGTADPSFGVDTIESPYHAWIADLMGRLAKGYCVATAPELHL
ncbi:DUF4392 domain-containing protein (plasmid) [Mesorhizobium sp. AR02]|uniref:DUF4392 domain-containing protein n=1 Tax=Mesorhizobium sp. AR02 TaxID=2865837 RepID=UPI0021610168|nr:DUF4392 domain-containing protein [Mesorhizobium sp. AR02]UVK49652.1 DUF4392 domain-containing protein [Mesorhizobium sp. AR02]